MKEIKNRKIVLECSVILALLLVISAFKFVTISLEKKELQRPTEETIYLTEAVVAQEEPEPVKKKEPQRETTAAPEAPPEEVPDDVEVESKAEEIKTLDISQDRAQDYTIKPKKGKIKTPKADNKVYQTAEQNPTIIGSISDAVKYPRKAKNAGVQGTVFIGFVVDKNGKATNIEVIRSPNSLLSEAAIDAVKRLEFNPGRQNGKPVKVKMSLPIRFQLN